MRFKTILGIVLVCLSLVGMYFWESKFRDEVTLTTVLVAAAEINAGDVITEGSVKEFKIRPEEKLQYSVGLSDLSSIEGKTALYPFHTNQQLQSDAFYIPDDSDETVLPDGQREFTIRDYWIFSAPVNLKKNERVMIYALPDRNYLGTYTVTDVSEGLPYYYVRIIGELDNYFEIYDSTEIANNNLILVYEEESWEQ